MNVRTSTTYSPWLHRFAVLTALCTFLLLGAGGLVTSHEAGMSVPDWPNSYGYNMFLFPPSKWIGGIIYEHTHRLIASGVGLLTTILAVWLWLKDPRKWMHWVGVAAFLLVVAQGILGGLRVVLSDALLGIIHGVVGQSFFILMCAIALFTSRFWQRTENQQHSKASSRPGAEALKVERSPALRRLVLLTTILIFVQLLLGATMRGQHAGLAIPDFPLAYGKLWPDTSPAALVHYNAERMNVLAENGVTRFQILLQMVHRLVALAIFVMVSACAWQARGGNLRQAGPEFGASIHRRISIFWLALIIGQIGLGAWTIWSNKAADVATLHLMGGALALMTGALWCTIAFWRPAGAPQVVRGAAVTGAFGASPSLAGNK
jgi:heme a synthase